MRWCIVLAIIVCYLPHVLYGQFVYEDAAVLQSVAAGAPELWHPRGLFRLLWWLQWQASPHPALFHAMSVALHLVVVALTGILGSRLGLTRAAVTLTLIVTAWHPLTVEAVAYAAQQGELLAAIGVLTACIFATGRWWRAPVWVGILAAVAFGLLGKESAVVAIALVPLLIVARAPRYRYVRPRWAGAWMPVVLSAALLGTGVWWYGWTVIVSIGEAPGADVTAVDWLLVQSYAAMRMVGLLVIPMGPFSVDYDYDAVPVMLRVVTVVGLAGLWSLVALTWRRWPHGALGLAWMLIVIAPRLIVQTPRGIFNEHQAYLMVPGFALLVGAALDRWANVAIELHFVRLGRLSSGRDRWAACYRRDSIARHWWIDGLGWRLCLISASPERPNAISHCAAPLLGPPMPESHT